MIGVDIDPKAFISNLTEIEKRRLPQLTLRSLNDAAFEVRAKWKEEIPSVFDRPTPLTLSSPLYKKATLDNLTAEVYIRDDATKGTPPATYLQAQVRGGARRRKRSEIALQRIGFPPFFVPARGMRDAFGNIKPGLITKILTQLDASPDSTQRESARTRGRRLRNQRRRGGGGSYFQVNRQRGKLRPGIVYERIESAFGQSHGRFEMRSSVRPVLIGLRAPPRYSKRYDVFALAQQIFAQRFRTNFQTRISALTQGRL